MRLINPGIGEVSDRLSILALKILHATEVSKDATHFMTERAALLTSIRGRTLNGKWFEAYTDLAAVNAALWHAEDDLRALRLPEASRAQWAGMGLTYHQQIAEVAIRIQALNDRRAVLVQQINEEAGDAPAKEKV